MAFLESDVTARGGYKIQLDVTDKAQYMTPWRATYDFNIDYCLSLFEAESGQAFVEKELDEVLGDRDIYVYYDYRECSRTMGIYTFESISFKYVSPQLGVRDEQIDTTLKRFKITKQDQKSFNLNEYFTLVATA